MFEMTSARWDAVHDWSGPLVRQWFQRHWPEPNIQILDVGAGWGKYLELLPEYSRYMWANEVWQPTVEQEQLRRRYRGGLLVGDIYDLLVDWVDTAADERQFDVVILGDVLEHMSVQRAQRVLYLLRDHCRSLVAVIPYMYVQDEEEGNPYQRHVQDDLTPERMCQFYPELRLLAVESRDGVPFKGLYEWWRDKS